MQRLAIVLMIAAGVVGYAHAADLATDKPSEKPKPKCFASAMDWLNTSASECPMTYAGFTVYGTIDVGYGYNTAGIPIGQYNDKGIYYGIQKNSNAARWSWAPNAASASTLGVKMEEPLGGDWLLIGAAELAYNPITLQLANSPRSLTENNFNTAATATGSSDSSRAGQWDNSQGFIGISNQIYGTLTVGRVNALSTDVTSAYDPVRSNAFSLIGFSGAFPGLGSSQLTRVNTAVVYRVEYGNFRVAGLAQFGNGYALGNSSMGEYQAQIGATFGGLSVDAVFSYAKDAVTLSSYFDSGLPAGFDPNSILKATLSDNTGLLLGARYKWDQWEVYGGYTYARLTNPSDAFPGGFPTIAEGIFVPPGAVNATNYNVDRILNSFWTGAKYSISSNLSVAAGVYFQIQNNYLQAPSTCTGSGASTSSNKCAGSQAAESFMITYKPVKRIDLYAGIMVSNVYGGLASGFFKTQDIDPTVGIRVRF
jgi:predicted porin